MMEYLAHINSETGNVQTVEEHLNNTAKLCREYSADELKDIAFIIGLLHDVGKYSDTFQKRIRGASIKYEHSIIGAKLIERILAKSPTRLLMQLCISGHHTGIPNCGNKSDSPEDVSLYGRLKRDDTDFDFNSVIKMSNLEEICKDFDEINRRFLNLISLKCRSADDAIELFAFYTRYCFSCLTDADTIDTVVATGGDTNRSLTANFTECINRLEKKLATLKIESVSRLQKARAEIQKQAFEAIDKNAKLYLMNMPTGSGKTLTGLYCALYRAVKTQKKRLIYVIPYNSIINQTAEIFERLFKGCAKILRHQSSFSYEVLDGEDEVKAFMYSTENWDAQIIITTAVQFFESVYSNKRSKLRKFHNIGDSILVFDEAHLMPINYLQPCLRAVVDVVNCLNSEALFLTATMPDFRELIHEYAGQLTAVDLIEDKSYFSEFKKCKYKNLSLISTEELMAKATQFPSSLVIVNNRRTARELYSMCSCKKYHLSTYMTSFDRDKVIKEIRSELDMLEKKYPDYECVPENERIVVISTSLIEAGVDVDFFTVFREISGLDNILQAGGRCNREGKRNCGKVYIFSLENDSLPGDIGIRINITNGIIRKYNDISSQEAIREYYEHYYKAMQDSITQNSLSKMCGGSIETIPFADYSVKIIDSKTVSVVIDENDESHELINRLRQGYPNIRKLQKYSCTVYENERNELSNQGVIESCDSGISVLTNNDYYNKDIGIMFEINDYIL